MKTLLHTPESPITEEWDWITDVLVGQDGTEQRVCLIDTPKRSLQLTYQFTEASSARALIRSMFTSGSGVMVPFWHQQTKLTAPAAIGAQALAFDPSRTDLRDGCTALLWTPRGGPPVPVGVAVVTPGGCTLSAPLAAPWPAGGRICPVWPMLPANNAAISRGHVDAIADATLSFSHIDFADPFLNPHVAPNMTLFNGDPIMLPMPMGDSFDHAYDNGTTQYDYGGIVAVRNLWKHSKLAFTRDFLCQRILNPADWDWWRAFADHCKGSFQTFYMPTHAQDFDLVQHVAGNAIVFATTDYHDSFFGFDSFNQVAISTDAGWHYASVTACAIVNGNSQLTIDPPLPDGAGYATNQLACLLLKLRIADDKISIDHDGLQSKVTIAMRTVDE